MTKNILELFAMIGDHESIINWLVGQGVKTQKHATDKIRGIAHGLVKDISKTTLIGGPEFINSSLATIQKAIKYFDQ